MKTEERRYVYEKAEQLAAEVEELLNEARLNTSVETRDDIDTVQLSECIEEAYRKIENIEELVDEILENCYESKENVKANYELAADMLEELRHAKKVLHESLDILDKEDWHVEELADKINEVYVDYNFEAIELSH